MRPDAVHSAPAASVTGAIRQAARLTGTNFQYLLATARVESNLEPRAAAKTSSAGGLFQFIDQTWLGTLKESGQQLGYGHYAEAITKNGNGRYVVADPARRAEIMKLRQDPAANAVMAGALTRSNAAYLEQKLGRPPKDSELYIAHFLGARGAAKLIGLGAATPNAIAADGFPQGARANRSIFFSQDGRPRSFADVARVLSRRYDVARLQGMEDAPRVASAAEPAKAVRAYEAQAPEAALPASPNDDAKFAFRNPYRIAENGSARTEKRHLAAPPPPASPMPVSSSAPAPGNTQTAALTAEPLGLFQDMKPNVRALFTGG